MNDFSKHYHSKTKQSSSVARLIDDLFSVIPVDLRLLEEDPTAHTIMITRGLQGPPTIRGGRASLRQCQGIII